ALALAIDRVARVGVAAQHRPGTIAIVDDRRSGAHTTALHALAYIVFGLLRDNGGIAGVREGGNDSVRDGGRAFGEIEAETARGHDIGIADVCRIVHDLSRGLLSFPTRRSSDLALALAIDRVARVGVAAQHRPGTIAIVDDR